ncbi:MAG: TatD family hydrolase [Candidatus Diapherotrites archaeon]|nr:TatD family hydrolase [Candidatus Diapherotrites archaeon]
MHLIDVHCHFNEVKEQKKALKESIECNVKTINSNSVDLNSMKANLELSSQFKEIKCSLGIHPSNILSMNEPELNESMQFIEKNVNKAIALGETGLDFKHAKTIEEKEKQKKYFIQQIELSKKFSKPLIIHSRYAGKECLKILKEKNAEKVLMHWFTNSEKEILQAVEQGYFISVGPSVLFSIETQKNVLKIPLNKILLETDSPVSFNGKNSEPCWIKEIAEKLAEMHKKTLEEITEITYTNAVEFFSLQYK